MQPRSEHARSKSISDPAAADWARRRVSRLSELSRIDSETGSHRAERARRHQQIVSDRKHNGRLHCLQDAAQVRELLRGER